VTRQKVRKLGWLVVLVLLGGWRSLSAADDCLACHARGSGLTNSAGKPITVDSGALKASVHRDLACLDCHAGAAKSGHTAKTASASCLACHPEVAQDLAGSAHRALGDPKDSSACLTCHGDHNVVKPSTRGSQFCFTCHETEVKEFAAGVHGRAQAQGNTDVPRCQDCHGATHKGLAGDDRRSPVQKANLPDTCGHCHSNPALAAKYHFAVALPVEAYKLSYHARAIRNGNLNAATCNDCHGVHKILPASDPSSPIWKPNVGATCGKCHEPVFAQYKESVHGRAVAAGVMQSPTCPDCHGEHAILAPLDPNSPVFVTNVSRDTCARCHEDQRLMERFNVPGARVPSFEDSYHGLAAKAGSKSVANCASCHGVHNILPSTDPRSTVAKANLAATCGKCHPDAGRRFTIGPVHVVPPTSAGGRVLEFVRWFYLLAIPTILGGMLLHNALDWWRKARRRLAQYRASHSQVRMTLSQRWQHALLLASFIVLVITGFALKFPEAFWAAPFGRWEGVYPLRGLIHRIAAVVLMAAGVYHLIYLAINPDGRKWLRAMLPLVRDVRESIQTISYNLGWRPSLPSYTRFNYIEKAEYWALVWGTVVMATTGILLWAHNLVLEYLPKTVLDLCTAVHYYEAILATFAILIWHFYWVIFDPDVYPLKWTFLTGRAPEHEVREEEEEPPLPPPPGRPAKPTSDSPGQTDIADLPPAPPPGSKDVD